VPVLRTDAGEPTTVIIRTMPKPRLSLCALIYQDDDCWVAHCLETDVVAEGSTPTKAFVNLQSLTEFQIERALEDGDLESVFRPAPPEIHAAFARASDQPISATFGRTRRSKSR
jgi:predicted RNase H-like HicB family nuclease